MKNKFWKKIKCSYSNYIKLNYFKISKYNNLNSKIFKIVIIFFIKFYNIVYIFKTK